MYDTTEIISPDVGRQLAAYAQRLQSLAIDAAEQVTRYVHEETVRRARDDPDWADLADNIEVWSQDGQMVIGVQDQMFVSQAFALEYGDEVRPPNPLLRTVGPSIKQAEDMERNFMQANFGFPDLTRPVTPQ